MTVESEKELLRKLTERNKIADFAMQVLKMDERRADAFIKVCGDFLTWDGTLKFKTASGQYVAADDEQCTGFFRREFDYLIPPKANEEQGDIPADLIEKAKAGSVTARGQIFRLLHGDKHRSAEGETTAALDKLLATGSTERERDSDGKFKPKKNGNGAEHGGNPFMRLRDASGKINEAAAAEVAQMTKALGTKKVEAIARAANKTITGMPLRQ
jgi:hypothetical protein